jgi:hypothetical protein
VKHSFQSTATCSSEAISPPRVQSRATRASKSPEEASPAALAAASANTPCCGSQPSWRELAA